MNPIPGNVLLLLLALILGSGLVRALPMTNDDQELTALEQSLPQEHRRTESEFVGRIAPRHQEASSDERPEEQHFDTLVRELQAAGVQTADRRTLRTLTYKELVRLMALYHLAQGRNYYDAVEQKEAIA